VKKGRLLARRLYFFRVGFLSAEKMDTLRKSIFFVYGALGKMDKESISMLMVRARCQKNGYPAVIHAFLNLT
jgi:hypothetical protein